MHTETTDDETPGESVPAEFTKEQVAAQSPEEERLFQDFLGSGEPYKSLAQKNFHQSARDGFSADPNTVGNRAPTPGLDLSDDGLYYNTQGAAAGYWADKDLPQPTKVLKTLRADLDQWGYCLIEDALSGAQLARMQQRLNDQAAAERQAGIASWMGTPTRPGDEIPTTQFLHQLINKGEQFVQCVEHKPQGVQAGPLIEQLLNETMGRNFLMSSFIGIISNPFNMPQGLHQDQAIAPFQDATAPYTVNTMYVMDDMGAHNGGTLVVPGSHKLLSDAGSGQPLAQPLPPAINLNAKAGTVMIFEGRLLHGTGVNMSEESRTILVMNSIKPFMRQQELHMMSAHSELLRRASPKLLYRLGARPTGLGGIEGAWNGDFLVEQRLRMDAGEYVRVGELTPDDPVSLTQDFGYRYSEVGQQQAPHQPEVVPTIKQKYSDATPAWHAPKKS